MSTATNPNLNSQQPLEDLIALSSRLKDSVVSLYEAYRHLPDVISREEKAIVAGDFVELSAKCEEKEALSLRIEGLFSAMTKAGEQIHQTARSVMELPVERPTTLSQYMELLAQLSAHYGTQAFAAQVFAHVVGGLSEQVGAFMKLYVEVKPKIEANRYLIGKMMSHFQQSYRFWNEVSEQMAISYNAHGVQQAAGRNHGFKVRA